MEPKILTAIFVTGKKTGFPKWYKYRKISASKWSLNKFLKFAQNKGADEVNFYDSKTGDFWGKFYPGR